MQAMWKVSPPRRSQILLTVSETPSVNVSS